MNIDTNTILIHDNRTRLVLELRHRQYPDNTDYWDGNWIVTRFHAVTSGFQVDFTETIHLCEIVRLREELAKMHTTLEGWFEWKALDGFFDLVAEMDGLGHICWAIQLSYPAGMGTRLSLEIENDQSYLPNLLSQIEACLDEFPVVGERARQKSSHA